MDATTQPRIRWFHLTPGRLVLLLLAIECLLWLSERVGWLGWHKGYAVLTGVASVGVAMVVMLVWFGVALIFRRRFQFSIRSLLVLVVVVAMPCSWLAVEMKRAREQKQAVDSICASDGFVIYAEMADDEGWFDDRKPQLPSQGLLVQFFGESFFYTVSSVHLVQAYGFRWWSQGGPISLGGLVTKYTKREGARSILLALKDLPDLRALDLSNMPVDDSDTEYIIPLTGLRHLYLSSTRVTDSGVAKLQQALPNCKITR